RKLAAERPLKDIRDEYNYPKKKGIKDECSRLLEASTMKSRRGFAIQRLMNAMRQAHAEDRKSGSAGMPRPISYAVFCLKKKKTMWKRLCHRALRRYTRADLDELVGPDR